MSKEHRPTCQTRRDGQSSQIELTGQQSTFPSKCHLKRSHRHEEETKDGTQQVSSEAAEEPVWSDMMVLSPSMRRVAQKGPAKVVQWTRWPEQALPRQLWECQRWCQALQR